MKFITTALKGMAMGAIDIVPGVSGSTVAVLLGIYERFIAGLKSIDWVLICAICGVFRHGFSKESRENLKKTWREKDMPWLLNLVLGLGLAMVCASFFIPWLMENYPDIARGFFFGLVLGSAIQPITKLKRPKIHEIAITICFAAACFFMLGQNFNPPSNDLEIIANGTESLAQLASSSPTLVPPSDFVNLPQNAALHDILPASASATEIASYIPPAGTQFTIPTIPLWFSFIAGFCAICAMLLPGISGSFILLVLGVYYAAMSAARGTFSGLSHFTFPTSHVLTLGLLALGAVAGMACFSRVLTWLFKTHPRATYAAIVGILLGCLRAVWPFRETVDNVSTSVMPTLSTPNLPFIIIATIAALAIVSTTLYFQLKHKTDKE